MNIHLKITLRRDHTSLWANWINPTFLISAPSVFDLFQRAHNMHKCLNVYAFMKAYQEPKLLFSTILEMHNSRKYYAYFKQRFFLTDVGWVFFLAKM